MSFSKDNNLIYHPLNYILFNFYYTECFHFRVCNDVLFFIVMFFFHFNFFLFYFNVSIDS